MELKIRRYHKDGREMSPDYRPDSIPELEELIHRVYCRVETMKQQQQEQQKQESNTK